MLQNWILRRGKVRFLLYPFENQRQASDSNNWIAGKLWIHINRQAFSLTQRFGLIGSHRSPVAICNKRVWRTQAFCKLLQLSCPWMNAIEPMSYCLAKSPAKRRPKALSLDHGWPLGSGDDEGNTRWEQQGESGRLNKNQRIKKARKNGPRSLRTFFDNDLSSPGWTRTNDNAVNSRTLYQLSYRGMWCGTGPINKPFTTLDKFRQYWFGYKGQLNPVYLCQP